MPEIITYLRSLLIVLKKTTLKNLTIIVSAMLCMTGNKTMLNISRWSTISYKTIERFYNSVIPWLDMNIILIILKLKNKPDIILAGDETTVIKSGKKTFGIDLFFNSIYQKPLKSLCFAGLSLIDTDSKKSYSLLMSQLVFTPQEKENLRKQKEKRKKSKGEKRGRKKGSKNNPNKKTELPPTFRLLKSQLEEATQKLKINYWSNILQEMVLMEMLRVPLFVKN